MDKCLVTQLKGSVNDPTYELRTFGALRISFPADSNPTEINLQSNTGGKIVVLKGGTVKGETEVNYVAAWTHYAITEADGLLVDITNKYDLVKCEALAGVIYTEELRYSPNLTFLGARKLIGKLSDTPNLTIMTLTDATEYVVDIDIPVGIELAYFTSATFTNVNAAKSIYKCIQCKDFRCQHTQLTAKYGVTAETIVEGMCENGRESGQLNIAPWQGITIYNRMIGDPINCTFSATGCTVTSTPIGTMTYNKTTHEWTEPVKS